MYSVMKPSRWTMRLAVPMGPSPAWTSLPLGAWFGLMTTVSVRFVVAVDRNVLGPQVIVRGHNRHPFRLNRNVVGPQVIIHGHNRRPFWLDRNVVGPQVIVRADACRPCRLHYPFSDTFDP